ncbi:MAG: DUF4349 domain-containing protein [Clostridia bacterium]
MKKVFAILFSVLLLLSLCACGAQSAKSASRDSYVAGAPAEAPMPEPEMAMDEEAAYGGFAANGMEKADAPEAEKPQVDPEKIIYSADATVETTEFEQTLEKLQALVQQYGGFIESSSINGSNYYSQARGYGNNRSANYTIRIPSARFSELMGSLSTLGNVPYTYTYTQNITSRYYDVQARLTAYETQEKRLLEMMEKAETVSDIIVIEDRLTELRYQIESLQSTLNNWDRQVSYSTVNVTVSEVTIFTPEAKLSYGQRLGLAVRNGLQSTGEFFSDFLLWFLEALPALIILAVLVVLAILIIRKARKKRRARKAAERAAKE